MEANKAILVPTFLRGRKT